MTKFKIDTTFINREKEMAELRNYLEGRPNSILFLYGPKSSGKTTLMYRLFEQPVDGIYGIQGKSLEWGIKGYCEETETDILFAKNAGLFNLK